MSFVRLRRANGKYYYASLVENYREDGKHHQRVLQNYGRVDRGLVRRLFKRKSSKVEINRTVERAEQSTSLRLPEGAE